MKPLMLIGEAFGENEARTKVGFVGASGIELLRMLHESGLIVLSETDFSYIAKYYSLGDSTHIDMIWRLHPEVYRTNVFNLHPPGNNLLSFCGPKPSGIAGFPALVKGKFVSQAFIPELERLADEILRVDPNLIVCLGNSALWALAGKTGVSKLRGTTCTSTHTVSGYKLLPTYHPAAVLRQWELRPTVLADLMKAKREKEFPDVRRPKREIWIEPSLADLEDFYERYIVDCRILSVDIETSGRRITCIGFAPSTSVALVLPFDDDRRKGRSYWNTSDDERSAWVFVAKVLEDRSISKVFQNGMYDIAFIWRSTGIKVYGAEEDTMLLHHALQPEALKGLGYLGSVYTDEGPWKSERKGTATIKRDE